MKRTIALMDANRVMTPPTEERVLIPSIGFANASNPRLDLFEDGLCNGDIIILLYCRPKVNWKVFVGVGGLLYVGCMYNR